MPNVFNTYYNVGLLVALSS